MTSVTQALTQAVLDGTGPLAINEMLRKAVSVTGRGQMESGENANARGCNKY